MLHFAVCWIMHLTRCHDEPHRAKSLQSWLLGWCCLFTKHFLLQEFCSCTYNQGKDRGDIPQIFWATQSNERGWFFPFNPVAPCFFTLGDVWRRREDQLWCSQFLHSIFSSVTAVYVTLICHPITLGSPARQVVSLIPQYTAQGWLTALFEVYLCCLKSWLLVWKTHIPGIISLLWFETLFQRTGVYCMEML